MAETTLYAVIALKDQMSSGLSNVQKSLANLSGAFNNFGRLANIALFSIKAALIYMGKEAIESAMKLTQLSRITGMSTQTLQELSAAAVATGANFDRLVTGMKLLSEKAEKAAEGNRGFIELFNRMGLSIYDTNGQLKNSERLFNDFADVIASAKNPTQQMGIAVEFLGRSGEELLPMLAKGSAGLREFARVAQASGYIMSTETVKALDIAGKQMETLKTIAVNMTGEWMANTGVTVPKIIELWFKLVEALQYVIGWVKKIGNAWVETWKFVGEVFVILMDNIINKVKMGLKAGVDAIENYVLNIAQILRDLGKDEWADKLTTGIVKLKAALGTMVGSNDFAKDVADAWENMGIRVEAQNNAVDASTKEVVNDVKQRGAAIQEHVGLIAKANTEVATSTGKTLEDMNAKIHTFAGGFEEAAKEFVRNAGDWKAAWLGTFNSLESGISSVFSKFIMEGGKFRDVMKSLFKSIEQSFVEMITKMLVQKGLAALLGMLLPGETNNSTANVFSQNASGANGQNASAGAAASQAMGAAAAMAGNVFGGGATSTGSSLLGMSGSGLTMVSLAGLGIGAGLTSQGIQHGNVTKGTVGGLVSGAALGTMIYPGVGTVIGAVVGAAAGFFTSSSAKEKLAKEREAQEKKQKEQEKAMREQARKLLTADIRAKYGGGLADVSAVTDIGKILSGGITDKTLDELGAQNIVNQAQQIGTEVGNIQVGSPNIVVNATVAGAYDVQRFAQDLGIQLASSIKTAVAGASI